VICFQKFWGWNRRGMFALRQNNSDLPILAQIALIHLPACQRCTRADFWRPSPFLTGPAGSARWLCLYFRPGPWYLQPVSFEKSRFDPLIEGVLLKRAESAMQCWTDAIEDCSLHIFGPNLIWCFVCRPRCQISTMQLNLARSDCIFNLISASAVDSRSTCKICFHQHSYKA
jgi:hypothetical protein